MMHKIRLALLTLAVTAATSLGLGMAPAAALPVPQNLLTVASASKQEACAGLKELDATQGCGTAASKTVVSNLAQTAVGILSIIIGVASVIMIIISGLRYVTSNGDSNNVSGAKSALIYALVGLAVASLAQFMVHFVLHRV